MTTQPVAERATRTSRFPCVDGLRALAALAVFAYHSAGTLAFQDRDFLPQGVLNWLSRLGSFGVAVFFVISGFLLYRPFVVAALSDRPTPRWAPFWKRRLFRILPAYWVALAGAAFLFSQVQFDSVANALVQFGLARNFQSGRHGGLGVAWTLELEVSFYLALPLLAALIRRASNRSTDPRLRARAQIVTVAGLAATALALRFWYFFELRPDPAIPGTWFVASTLPKLVPMYLDWFAFGMALAIASAWLSLDGQIPRVVAIFGRFPALSWLVAIECYWIVTQLGLEVFRMATPLSATQTCLEWAFNGLAAAFFVLPAVLGSQADGAVRRILTTRVLVMTSVVSYGIYLWHQPIWIQLVEWFPHGMPMLVQVGIVFATTALVAVASWQIVERPLIRFSGGNAPRLVPARATPAAGGDRPLEPAHDRERSSVQVAVASLVALLAIVSLGIGSRNLNNLVAIGALDAYPWPDQHALVWDDFDRADKGGLGTAASGQRWQTLSGSWSIEGDRAVATTIGSTIVPVRASHVRAIGGGITFRCLNARNCWWILPVAGSYTSTWAIQKIVDGKVTTVGNVGLARIDDAVPVAVHCQGNRIVVAVDGVVRRVIFDPDLAGAAGVGLIHGSGNAPKAWSQFEASR